MNEPKPYLPGACVLLGSGETLASSRPIHEYVFRRLPSKPQVVILETPAGFEPNSRQVAGKIKDFLMHRLQNYQPRISVIAARKKETPFSPDSEDVVAPILEADEIILGPGSPTYAARQLHDSLALKMITARHFLGASVFLSSAATLAFGHQTMPVYEIYKVGQDLHWQPGLDFFAPYGLRPILVPHWNNNDGGDELDTSRCYMGRARFEQLCEMLDSDQIVVGIDEHTALIMEMANGTGLVKGLGRVVIRQGQTTTVLAAGSTFPLSQLGPWELPAEPPKAAAAVWDQALEIAGRKRAPADPATPSEAVLALVAARNRARDNGDWQTADQLREQIIASGWQVMDTPNGTRLEPIPSSPPD